MSLIAILKQRAVSHGETFVPVQVVSLRRIFLTISLFPFLILLSGCLGEKVPECHDANTTDLVAKGVRSAFQDGIGDDVHLDEYFDFKMENPIVVSYDKAVRKRSCEMSLTVTVKPIAIAWTNKVFKKFEPTLFNLELLAIDNPKFKDAYAAYMATGKRPIETNKFTGSISYVNQMQSGSESRFVTSWRIAFPGADDNIRLKAIASIIKIGAAELKTNAMQNKSRQQAEVTVMAYGLCPGSDEAVCVETNKGAFTANAFALSDEQKQLLTAALMEKKSVCLMDLETASGAATSFDAVSAHCDSRPQRK